MDWKLGRLGILGTLGCALVGCNYYANNEAQELVAKQLKDPESARFNDVKSEGNGLITCGSVNAKNGFGAYAGATQFMVWKDHVFIAQLDEEQDRMQRCCAAVSRAVRDHIDSANLEGFEACGSLVKPFTW